MIEYPSGLTEDGSLREPSFSVTLSKSDILNSVTFRRFRRPSETRRIARVPAIPFLAPIENFNPRCGLLLDADHGRLFGAYFDTHFHASGLDPLPQALGALERDIDDKPSGRSGSAPWHASGDRQADVDPYRALARTGRAEEAGELPAAYPSFNDLFAVAVDRQGLGFVRR